MEEVLDPIVPRRHFQWCSLLKCTGQGANQPIQAVLAYDQGLNSSSSFFLR